MSGIGIGIGLGLERGDRGTPVDRARAGRLLRAARHAPEDDALVDRAYAAAPSSRGARRLMIEALLRRRCIGAAETLIDAGLLTRPGDPTLSVLRALSLIARRRPRAARRELRPALKQRPAHVKTICVAAHVDRLLDDLPAAVERLARLARSRPKHEIIRVRLVETLAEAGLVGRARRVWATLADPSAITTARLLVAEGRSAAAVELLDRTRLERHAEMDRVTATLIELLERLRDTDTLDRVLAGITPSHPLALLHAGRAWLRLGHFDRAARRLAPLRRHPRFGAEAHAIIGVAASMRGRDRLAERVFRRLPDGFDQRVVADLWRRAMAAETTRVDGGRSAAVGQHRILPGLLEAAAHTLEPARRRRIGDLDPAEARRHHGYCLTAATLRRPAARIAA